MNGTTDPAGSLSGVINGYFANPVAAAELRRQLQHAAVEVGLSGGIAWETAVENLALCLEALNQQASVPSEKAFRAIRSFLVAWDRLSESGQGVSAADAAKSVFSHVPASMRGDRRWGSLLKQVTKDLGREPSRASVTAVVGFLDPAAAVRMLKSESDEAVLAALVKQHGQEVEPRILIQSFRRMVEQGFGSELVAAFAGLKYRTVAELLPFDTKGTLGQTLARSVLAAIFKPASPKTVSGILRSCGSTKAVGSCLDERVTSRDENSGHVGMWLRSFYEGLEKFSDRDAESLCGRLLAAPIAAHAILAPILTAGSADSWCAHARKAIATASLRALAYPEQRMRAIAVLSRALDEGWLGDQEAKEFTESVSPPSDATTDPPKDEALRFRVCDRILACLETAAEQNYDRVALAATIRVTLGDFGLRIGACAGDQGAFDSRIHETTLWEYPEGGAVLLQTDLLRLDDADTGAVIRRSKVRPL